MADTNEAAAAPAADAAPAPAADAAPSPAADAAPAPAADASPAPVTQSEVMVGQVASAGAGAGAGAGATAVPISQAAPLPGAPGAEAVDVDRWRSLSTHGGEQARVELAWGGLNLTVGSGAKEKRILHGLSGIIRPGRLTAIMGPSGAGKSSLLNVLAGRTRTGITGNITANGITIDPVQFRQRIAYVMQEDALFPTQTPREALMFSAALRLPKEFTHEQRVNIVENIIKALGLAKCADTLIGGALVRGISGGEKKRTAIGVELVASPDILFLDEPTSGLDSFAAFQVVKILRSLAASGRTVVTTIHQPSSEVFENFDDVLLLANGHLVYHSSVTEMNPYFANMGVALAAANPDVDAASFMCRPHYNPADFVMFLMQQQSKEGVEAMSQHWKKVSDAATQRDVEAGVARTRSNSSMSKAAAFSTSNRDRFQHKLNIVVDKPGIMTQFWYLGRREVLNVVRDKASLAARFGTTIFLNIIVACVFYQGASWDGIDATQVPEVISRVNSQFGVVVQIAIGGMFGLAQPTLLAFPQERPVFLREYATGCYSAPPYFLSKMMAEIPVTTAQAALIFLCTYWLTGLAGNFFVLTLVIALLGMVASSTSLVIGAIANSVEVALQMTPLLFVPQLLFAGFFIPVNEIPAWLRWAQYLCSLKYSLNVVVLVEFDRIPDDLGGANATLALNNYRDAVYGCHGADLDLDSGTCAIQSGTTYDTALLPRSEIEPDSIGVYLGILLGVLVAFRIIALLALVFKARHH